MLLIGADPELFVQKNGTFISGHIFPCGTKEEPTKTPHGAIQNDGLALEFNVIPSKSKQEFYQNLQNVLSDLNGVLQQHDPTCELKATPSVWFGEDFLASLPERVSDLGCNPDWNAYTLDFNPTPNKASPIRTGSGHVHLGWEGDHNFKECCALVRELDYYLGLPSLDWDKDDRRRSLYGKAGAFRPKPYGVEYRVLSNAWVLDAQLVSFVYDQTVKAFERFNAGIRLDDEYEGFAEFAINGNKDWKNILPEIVNKVMG